MIIGTRAASVVGCDCELKQVLIMRSAALAVLALTVQDVPRKIKKAKLSFDMTSVVLVALSAHSSESTV